MAQATQGDTVHIHYTGRLDDGTVFDTSKDRDPLSFVVGGGQVIPGFDSAVEGMTAGDTKTATVAAAEAYGQRRDDLVMPVPREQLPDGLEPEVGMPLEMRTAEGQTAQVIVAEVAEDAIQIDANHPLAGRDLTFDIELVKVDSDD